MAIILEGFDGAGKSTLAEKLGFSVMHAGGPPRDFQHMKECLDNQLAKCEPGVIFDRVTCISHQVYGGHMFDSMLLDYMSQMLRKPHTILVYCRPPDEILMDFSRHIPKIHDSKQHLEDIEANVKLYIERYDHIMSTVANVKFDYTKHGEDVDFINALINTQVSV